MITVGLPNFASPIAWLAMESLCRQITNHEWELIIYEDSDKPLGALFYSGYTERLNKAGMVSMRYEYSLDRVPLNQKWLWMGRNAHPESVGLILQASDCYSEPNRIETAYNAFAAGYNWVQSSKGCFYFIDTGQMMLFDSMHGTGLNMAISREALKRMPNEQRWSGVDYWLFANIDRPLVYYDDSENWKQGIDTDGFNRISTGRRSNYNNPKPPFFYTTRTIEESIPMEIVSLLNDCKHSLK